MFRNISKQAETFRNIDISTITTKRGTQLSVNDVEDIVRLVQSGMSYKDVTKKYSIGTHRLYRILALHKCGSLHTTGGRELYMQQTITEKNYVTENSPTVDTSTDFIMLLERKTDELTSKANNITIKNYLDD